MLKLIIKNDVRPEIVNANCDDPIFYPFSIKTSKCSDSCNNTNDLYAKLCVPDIVKNINIKVFDLMSKTNKTKHVKWHETCKCECRLGASVCNNKQRWNKDKCRCECKELTDKKLCDKEFTWNPCNYECELDKSCDVGEYVDYANCKCRKSLVDKLIEECTANAEEAIECNSGGHKSKCRSSRRIYVALTVIVFTICIRIGAYFAYKCMNHWYLKNDVTRIKCDTLTQTTIY